MFFLITYNFYNESMLFVLNKIFKATKMHSYSQTVLLNYFDHSLNAANIKLDNINKLT